MDALRKSLKFSQPDALEKAIKELEDRIQTESFKTLAEEKKVIAEKQQLQALRPQLRAFQQKQEDVSQSLAAVKDIKERLRKKTQELGPLIEAKKKLKEEVDALKVFLSSSPPPALPTAVVCGAPDE